MANLTSICVYCGSRAGNDPAFAELATELGTRIAKEKIRLIYGGGQVGLMGIVADAAILAGGEVIGIIPDFLDNLEVGHPRLTELRVVSDMHSRKKQMFDLSDAFVALPGGIGTLDETVEMMTWRQLKQHDKPIMMLDHDGYWQPFINLLNHIVANDFATSETAELIQWPRSIDQLFAMLHQAPIPQMPPHSERL